MKRYWLFYGTVYYPSGGMKDYKGDYDTLEEAKAAFLKWAEEEWGLPTTFAWCHIYDSEVKSIIWTDANPE